MVCELCQADEAYNAHHLIPRHCHRKNLWKRNYSKEQLQQTIAVCKMCHATIHDLLPDEKVIGRDFNTIAKLQNHPALANYLEWKRKRNKVGRRPASATSAP